MKTSNYLIALAALTSLTLVGCSDNDFIGEGPGGTFGGSSSKGELSFAAGGGKTTRAEITGEAAALKLNKKFTVYGWKQINTNSDATAAFQDVFQDYVVEWKGAASAGTSESNTAGWEYVGGTSQPVDGSQPYDQTIKYWDWSTDRYDFQAWSISKGNAQILSRNTVSDITTPTNTAPELQFFVPTANDLGGVYVSDKFTSVPYLVAADLVKASGVAGAKAPTAAVDWSSDFDGGLANVENAAHPGKEYHRGKYSRIDNYTNYDTTKDGIVNLQFRNLAAKVRIGIYETIPGYKVSDVVFYEKNANNDYSYAWEAPSTEYTADLNADYPADQTYATLFADDKIFARRATVKVLYHDGYYMSGDAELDNVAYTEMTPEGEKFFAFGQLTKEKGSTTPIGSDFIGETSNTASMSIGNDDDNLYTYVFPMEKNKKSLELKVNYKLTSLDGSGEVIRVTGANATVPAEFAMWRSNYAYTYLFKVSDNTNGMTGEIYGPEGLYPITFDACLVNTEDGMQETITTINNKSITTYQDGSRVTANDEYKIANGLDAHDIYFTVESATANILETLTKGTNVKLYTAWAPTGTLITEESVANYKNNDIVLTDVTDDLQTATSAPNSSGAKYAIEFGTGKCLFFTPKANIYVVKYDNSTDITYKVIKIQDGSATTAYAFSAGVTLDANNGSGTFTVKNTNADTGNSAGVDAKGAVTGAKDAIVIKLSSAEADANGKRYKDMFEITEGVGTGDNKYEYTIKSVSAPAGTYTMSIGTATAVNVIVPAPVWWTTASINDAIINIEEGETADVTLLGKASGAAIAEVKPVITPVGTPTGKLTATETNTSGVTTLTASEGAVGAWTVSYNGASFTVQVDKYALSTTAPTAEGLAPNKNLQRAIINLGDTDHRTAVINLENKNTTSDTEASAVNTRTIAQTGTGAVTTSADGTTLTTSDAHPISTVTIKAKTAGNLTLSYERANMNVEVVNYSLVTSDPVGGVATVLFKKDGTPLDGASFKVIKADSDAVADASKISVTGTTGAGIYKVSSSDSGDTNKKCIVQYWYKNVLVADVEVTIM